MPDTISLTDPIEVLGLKDMDQEHLLSLLLDKPKWSETQRYLITDAYEMALKLHQNDVYKDQPYIYHLLRVANRITGYLRLYDAELVAAALLHDSIEDHSPDISGQDHNDINAHRQAAFAEISRRFSPRVSQLVALVTNEADRDQKLSEDEKISAYTAKVKQSIQHPDGWVIKFCDWCDNGVGIIHAIQLLSDEQIEYFQHKYGGEMLKALDERFHQPDLQSSLDVFAKGYVEHQLKLGHERLLDNEALAEEDHSKKSWFDKIFKLED